jgi:hypothetical protein
MSIMAFWVEAQCGLVDSYHYRQYMCGLILELFLRKLSKLLELNQECHDDYE